MDNAVPDIDIPGFCGSIIYSELLLSDFPVRRNIIVDLAIFRLDIIQDWSSN